VLVGVDELHVPPAATAATVESRHFVQYAAHNLLYVAFTRARFRVDIIGDRMSAPSKLLKTAIDGKLIEVGA
jgi:ATP-dependent exoDNAse (exonuclease V) beta subunit